MNIFVVTICQCYLLNRMTVNQKRSGLCPCRNRSVPVQEAEIRWKKVSLVGQPLGLLCLAAAQEITHSLSQLGELHVKAGFVSTLLAG